MINKKLRHKIAPVILICTMIFTGCGTNTAETDNNESTIAAENNELSTVSSSKISDLVTYDENDYYSDWENINPEYIELNGNSVTITKAGTYVISGTLEDGAIIVETDQNSVVRLVLNGVTIHCSNSSAINVKQSAKTIISLAPGTENTISDGTSYVLDAGSDEPDAAIFSKSDLTINGTGTLIVNGNYQKAIKSKDDLKIMEGTFTLNAVDDGIIGRDLTAIKDGTFTIVSGGDGIKSTNDQDTSKGNVVIENGTIQITSGNDGIQSENQLLIAGGDFTITSGGGSSTVVSDETISSKGLKAVTNMFIMAGSFTIDSSDDSIHSNNIITIDDGEFHLTTGDDGIHSDTELTINGGVIEIAQSYEGIESCIITITDGQIHITATDDGINVAGGNDAAATGMGGRHGQDSFSSNSTNALNINGGYMVVDASGDGLDANGSIYMTAGTVLVNGPTNSGNGALDYDGVFEISGGLLVAAGSSGMTQSISTSSGQYSIMMTFSTAQTAGTLVHVEDSEGNTVVTFAPSKSYQSVVISSPDLQSGSTYSIYSGGTATGTVTDGLYQDGNYEGGSLITDFTISDMVTYLNENGVTQGNTGGMGTPGGMGGGRGGNTGEKPSGEVPTGEQSSGERPTGEAGERPTGEAGERPTGELPANGQVEGTPPALPGETETSS